GSPSIMGALPPEPAPRGAPVRPDAPAAPLGSDALRPPVGAGSMAFGESPALPPRAPPARMGSSRAPSSHAMPHSAAIRRAAHPAVQFFEIMARGARGRAVHQVGPKRHF